jgi:hypothetical protein
VTARKVKPTGNVKELVAAKRSKGVLLPELRAVALKTAGDDGDRRKDVIHASELAHSDLCPRAVYFRIKTGKTTAESHSATMEFIFDEGNEIHAKWQRRMRQTGKLWGSWKCLICKVLSPDGWEPSPMAGKCLVGGVMHIWEYAEVHLFDAATNIIGHEDGGMVEHEEGIRDPYFVEVKSIGSGTVRVDSPDTLKRYYVETTDGRMIYDMDQLWKDLSRPFLTHIKQGNIYLWLAEQMGLPFKSVRFLYEYKFNQQVKEFVITRSDDIIEELLTVAAGINYALKVGKPPECPSGGCKYCKDEDNASSPSGSTADVDPVLKGRVGRRSQQAGRSGDRPEPVGTTTRRRAAADGPTRPDGGPRPAADEPLSRRRPVAPVPDAPAGSGGGRRVVRRKRPDTN